MQKKFIFFGCLALSSSICADKPAAIIPTVTYHQQHAAQTAETKGGKVTNTTVITAKQLKASGAKHISQALNNMAGVQLTDLYGDGSKLSISARGFTNSADALILLDGVPWQNLDSSLPDINAIPISMVKRIEVLPKSAGVLYGSGAISSVINIITKKPSKNQLTLSTGIGSYQGRVFSLAQAKKFKHHLYEQVFISKTLSNHYRDNNAENAHNLMATLGYQKQDKQAYIRFHHWRHRIGYPGALSDAQVKADRKQAATQDTYELIGHNDMTLHWEQALNQNWQWQNDLSTRYSRGSVSYGVNSRYLQRKQNIALNSRWLGQGQWGNQIWQNETGIEGQTSQYALHSSTTATTAAKQLRSAAYTQFNLPIFNALVLSFGGRGALASNDVDSNVFGVVVDRSYTERALAKSIALTYQPIKPLQLFMRRDDGFRFPNANEAAYTGNNSVLRKQTSEDYELGAKWQASSWSAKASVYHLYMRDEIESVYDPNLRFSANTNLAPTIRRGVLLSGKVKPIKTWQLSADYDYVNPVFSSGANRAKQIPDVAKSTLKLASDYQFTEHWQWHVDSQTIGQRFAGGDNANENRKFGGYTLVDTALHYQQPKWQVQLSINNIFNKLYYSSIFYSSGFGSSYYPAPERSYWLQFSWDLD